MSNTLLLAATNLEQHCYANNLVVLLENLNTAYSLQHEINNMLSYLDKCV